MTVPERNGNIFLADHRILALSHIIPQFCSDSVIADVRADRGVPDRRRAGDAANFHDRITQMDLENASNRSLWGGRGTNGSGGLFARLFGQKGVQRGRIRVGAKLGAKVGIAH